MDQIDEFAASLLIVRQAANGLGPGQSIQELLPLSRKQVTLASVALFTSRHTVAACTPAAAGQRQDMVQGQISSGKMNAAIVAETNGNPVTPPLRST